MPANPRKDEFAEARAAMVESQLRPQGISDPLVLEAMATVPRERFVPEESLPLAYSDRSVKLGEGRFMMPPAALGVLLQALEPTPGERALVVGAGSAYAAEVLRSMGVETVEGEPGSTGKGSSGFHLILLDGAVEEVPESIVAQLSIGGRLATAILDRGVTRLVVGTRTAGGFGLRSIGDAAVPPLPGFERPRAFVF
jgi:protein-L-isoaspartate(D-aspartate) O-methyltransferase